VVFNISLKQVFQKQQRSKNYRQGLRVHILDVPTPLASSAVVTFRLRKREGLAGGAAQVVEYLASNYKTLSPTNKQTNKQKKKERKKKKNA
jgi:hypothetical protein